MKFELSQLHRTHRLAPLTMHTYDSYYKKKHFGKEVEYICDSNLTSDSPFR